MTDRPTGPVTTGRAVPVPPSGPQPAAMPQSAAVPPPTSVAPGPPVYDAPAYAAPPTAPLRTPVETTRRRMGGLDLLLAVAAIVAVGGLAFAVGRLTAPTATLAGATGARGNGGGGFGGELGGNRGGGAGGFGGFGAGGSVTVQGTVVSVAADHITIKLANGTTVDIPTSSATTYHTQTAATSAAVTAGSTVQVQLDGRPRPGASAAPGSSPAARPARSASDVTVVSP